MRLSEAIRLGAMMKPQGSGSVNGDRGTCALGAALDAVGRLGCCVGWFEAYELWPIACEYVAYPGDYMKGARMLLGSACWNLNDADRWTREQIADWVATIEPAEQSTDADASAATDAVAVHVHVTQD